MKPYWLPPHPTDKLIIVGFALWIGVMCLAETQAGVFFAVGFTVAAFLTIRWSVWSDPVPTDPADDPSSPPDDTYHHTHHGYDDDRTSW